VRGRFEKDLGVMYNPRMKHARVVAFTGMVVFASALGGCTKLKSLLGKGEDGGAAAASGGGGLLGTKKGVGPLAFLNGFEGQIDVLSKGSLGGDPKKVASPPVTVNVLLKNGKVRVDAPPGMSGAEMMGGKAYGIYDGPGKKAYLVMDAQKQAILIDLNKTGETMKSMGSRGKPPGGPAAPTKPPPKVTKTGKTDKVAGYECELWDITDETSKGTMCIAEEGISWFSIPMTGAPAEYAWMAELMDGKHLPLRFVGFDKAGIETGRVEVTKIDKKSEPDAMFEVPPGYTVKTLEQMFTAPPMPKAR
jgi:hypothetical protein